jgi:hypothetical protein
LWERDSALISCAGPSDHTDKNYGSDQSVTKHCSLREQHPRILESLMSQFAPSGLTVNVQSGTHSDKFLEVWGESVQKRTDARYGVFYNAGLNRESRTKQPQWRVNDE